MITPQTCPRCGAGKLMEHEYKCMTLEDYDG